MISRLYLYMVLLLPVCFVCYRPAIAQECTVYSIPSPLGINWKSPKGMLFSYLKNIFVRSRYKKNKHPIGHMMIELKDSTRHIIAGTCADNEGDMRKYVLRYGYGLGILFTSVNGKLEENDINEPQVTQRCKTGDIAFITYKTSQPVFDRMWQYLQEYKQKGYHLSYNGLNKPREGLGAGCSAFALSFLEVGGLDSLLPVQEWQVKVRVPGRLLGGGKLFGRSVQFFKLLLAGHWASKEGGAGRDLMLYEPTKLYNWIMNKHNTLQTDSPVKTKKGSAPGLVIDCSKLPPPDEPIWNDNRHH